MQVWSCQEYNSIEYQAKPWKEAEGRKIMSDFYQVIPAETGHYRITAKDMVFMDLFVGTGKALLWDTGYGYGDLAGIVKALSEGRPLYIVNSHGHLDHACGNYQFAEDIYIHERDRGLCLEHTGQEMRRGALKNAEHNFNFMTKETENILPKTIDRERYIHGGSGSLRSVKEGDVFALGGITLEVFELPGHTGGSIGLYWKERDILFSGDAFNPFVWLFMPEALKLEDYLNTLHKAHGLGFTHFYMAHNPGLTDKKEILTYIRAAEQADFEKGFPFETDLAPGVEARVCALPGYGPQDFDKPGFAAVVLSKGHL